jgi:hypothetical protein
LSKSSHRVPNPVKPNVGAARLNCEDTSSKMPLEPRKSVGAFARQVCHQHRHRA